MAMFFIKELFKKIFLVKTEHSKQTKTSIKAETKQKKTTYTEEGIESSGNLLHNICYVARTDSQSLQLQGLLIKSAYSHH